MKSRKRMRIMKILLLQSFRHGLEWSLKDQMDSEALHAEMKSLLWETSCIRDKRITLNCFETDCSNLVDMTTNLMYWPSLATEIEVL
uniref:RNase H type-1 domain-containing protein n=1 Tax=Brassica oleracea TaxID=3712 RepID=A0A3P6DQ44_BRAOL|nr:unnamed protein product [Brassica oleracea]